MHIIYTLRYPDNTPHPGTVFYVGMDENGQSWEQEARNAHSGRPSHTARVIHYLWRNKKQPIRTIELQTDDDTQAQERYTQLLARYQGPQLTNRRRTGL